MNKRVMVVEDDEDISRNISKLLKRQGYNVEVASNGALALKALEGAEDLPCVIVLDIMMPVMDGFEFKKMQNEHPRLSSIPVIVMTADAHIESKKMRMGAQALIKKPIEINDMLETVGRFCNAN